MDRNHEKGNWMGIAVRDGWLRESSCASAHGAVSRAGSPAAVKPVSFDVANGVDVHWLDGTPPVSARGVSWGVPWPRSHSEDHDL